MIVDHRHQRATVAGNGVDVEALAALQRRFAQQLKHAQYAVERGANFVAHLGQKATLGLVLEGGLLGRTTRLEAFFLEQVDAVGKTDGQGDQLDGHADLHHRGAEYAEHFQAQRAGGGRDEGEQQDGPAQARV